ncbi:MAG: hypothetical protein EPO22_02930 [Dehalococcoidia bacterium]|nr:MAG: hypothetical protein EPO22_02930 [Dehalococcoidia bacterium]
MKKWILAVVAVAAIAVIGAGAVMAQTPGTGSGKTFLDRVAEKLGIDTPKLQNAIKDARTDQIDEAVQNGDLTQKQADALKQKLDQMPPDKGDFGFGFGHMKGPGPLGKGFGFDLNGAADKLAGFLGISQDQLRTELSAGNASLASVAQAHGKSRDDLKTFIKDTAKSALDGAVKNGDLTQKQEDNALSTLDAHLDQLIDGKFFGGMGKGFPFGGHGRGRHMGPNGATPGTSDDGMGMMEGLSRS